VKAVRGSTRKGFLKLPFWGEFACINGKLRVFHGAALAFQNQGVSRQLVNFPDQGLPGRIFVF